MWKCPKCGRTFCNDNQHHFCGKCKGPETIDEYIDEQGEDIRPQLEQVRNAIREFCRRLLKRLPGRCLLIVRKRTSFTLQRPRIT